MVIEMIDFAVRCRIRTISSMTPAVVTSFCLIALLSGCDQPTNLVPAAGIVKIDGKEAENITVQFLPDSLDGGTSGPSSFGSSDASGRFTLQTHDGKPGAVPGQHVVMLVDEDEERPAQGEPAAKPPRIPTLYSVVSSPLKITIVEGEEIVLDIVTK